MMKPLAALFVLFPLNSYALTQINSVPYTADKAGETYVLAKDLAQDSGHAITISADDITLDGNGKRLIYCGSGDKCSGVRINRSSNIEIHSLTFQQGATRVKAQAVSGNGGLMNFHDNILNLIARTDGSGMFGVNVDTNEDGSELHHNVINVTGDKRMKAHDASDSAVWLVHHNKVTITGLKQSTPGRYSRIFNVGNGS